MALATKNGKMANAMEKAEAFADAVLAKLDNIVEGLEYRRARDQQKIVAIAEAAAAATHVMTPVTTTLAGSSWVIERMTVTASPAANSQVEVYVNEIQPQNLITQLAVNAVTGMATQAPSNGFYIPPNTRLIIRFINQTIGVTVSVNFQVREKAVSE